eukprot:6693858-Prymnesium_polylepis.1
MAEVDVGTVRSMWHTCVSNGYGSMRMTQLNSPVYLMARRTLPSLLTVSGVRSTIFSDVAERWFAMYTGGSHSTP